MKYFVSLLFLLLFLPVLNAEQLQFGHFGTLNLYKNSEHPTRVAILASGRDGWAKTAPELATQLSKLDTLVIGVDTKKYLEWMEGIKASCTFPSGDFEALTKFVEKSLGYPQYVTPVLIGVSAGANLVYGTMAQAAPDTFAGGISLGFCRESGISKAFCHGYGMEYAKGARRTDLKFMPGETMGGPWVAFEGTTDSTCAASETAEFAKKVPHGSYIAASKAGAPGEMKSWFPEFVEQYNKINSAFDRNLASLKKSTDAALKDLPVIEAPSANSKGDSMAVVITGDGGWTTLDRQIGTNLAASGIPVVGLNSLRYFWNARTPEGVSKDLQRIMETYLAEFKKQKVILVGYSFGADVIPFAVNRLPEETRQKISTIALVGISHRASFEFHTSDWEIGSTTKKGETPIMGEAKKLKAPRILCFYGKEEGDSLCRGISEPSFTLVALEGNHGFTGDDDVISQTILKGAVPSAQK